MGQIIRNQLKYPSSALVNASDSCGEVSRIENDFFGRFGIIYFPSTSWNNCWTSKQLKLIYLSFVKIWLVSWRLEIWLISVGGDAFISLKIICEILKRPFHNADFKCSRVHFFSGKEPVTKLPTPFTWPFTIFSRNFSNQERGAIEIFHLWSSLQRLKTKTVLGLNS